LTNLSFFVSFPSDGKPMWLNDCRFRANRQCGYVLKPAVMLAPYPKFDPSYIPMSPSKILIVEIISGWKLKRDKPRKDGLLNPYVKIQVYGNLASEKTKAKTKVVDILFFFFLTTEQLLSCILVLFFFSSFSFLNSFLQNNGYNPVWKETFTFPLYLTEASILLLQVMDTGGFGVKSDETIAYATFLIDELEEGYKSIPLKGKNNQTLESTLLVQFSFYERPV
jgi:phosphatidylinositol phospholipase C eta